MNNIYSIDKTDCTIFKREFTALGECSHMTDYIFLFDLDSTITQKEILPTISEKINRQKEMRELTEATMNGIMPFKQSFLERVKILSDISVKEINNLVLNIPLNNAIADFIRKNHKRCYVVTGNLDVWISGLMEKLNMQNHYFCSKAYVENDKISKVISVLDKNLTVQQFVQPFVAMGDGDNDSDMAMQAKIAIGYGGVRHIAPSLLQNIDYAFVDDKRCVNFLNSLL